MLTRKEAAAYLGVSLSTLDTTLRSEIPRYKIGGGIRFKKTELDEYIEAHKLEPPRGYHCEHTKYVPGMKIIKPLLEQRYAKTTKII